MSIADLRREYSLHTLDARDVAADPVVQFQAWFADAERAQLPEPNAMTLATSTADGAPAARIVLLKGVDLRGFTFFTDYRSRKGVELDANPVAALVFLWKELERQVRIVGTASRVARDESEAYFRARPLGSRLGAWTSEQSAVLPDRATLEASYANVEQRFAGAEPPLPPHWGGYRIAPDEMEFWQGRPSRLHDRIRYRRVDGAWLIERLAP